MKLHLTKKSRRSILVASAALPIVVAALVFQNCSRARLNSSAAGLESVVNAKSMVGPCKDGSILGVWFSMWSPAGDVFAFTPDCHGSSSHCDSEFTYSKTGPSLTGQLTMRVLKTKSMPGCPNVGDHTCEYEISVLERRMHFRCDATQWAEFDMFSPVDGGVVKAPTAPVAPPPPVQAAVIPTATPATPVAEATVEVPPQTTTASATAATVAPPNPPAAPIAKAISAAMAKPQAKGVAAVTPTTAAAARPSNTPTSPPALPPIANQAEASPTRAPAAVAPAVAAGGKRIFISTSPYSGNLGGISGADLKCNSDPNKPPGVANAKALLSDGFHRVACANPLCDEGVEGQADWPLKPGTTYRDADGNLVGTTNLYGIFSGPMNATSAFANVKAWTGIKSDWTSSNEHCSSWGQTSRSTGMFGMPAGNGTFSAGAGAKLCDSSGFRLICVEQ